MIGVMLVSSIAHAAPSDTAANDPNLVSAPLLLKADSKNKDATPAAVVVEPTQQDPNALEIIRNELMRMGANEQAKHEKEGWLKSTGKRFTPESMTFFVAIGAVTFNSMWIKSHGDPLAMEKHILSLKDPIAHLSFGAFMLANGFYTDFRTKGMDAATKRQMMRRLSYQGMAIGSLASSITSDLGHSAMACVDSWIMGKTDEKSIASCSQAWQHWTVKGKFQQYFPQVIAMWASQAATEVIDAKTRQLFGKMTITETAKNLLNKDVLVNAAKKITAADALITFSPIGGGTWTMRGVKWVGKLTQFTTFVAVDHAMSPYTYRPINNLLKPMTFDFDALAINNFWSAADNINWEDSRINEGNKMVCSVHNPNCLETRLVGEIEGFSEQMQQWREHLNSDAETDIAGWMEMTKKLLNQVDYSYKFYKSFVTTMFETLNIGSRIQSNELPKEAAYNISLFPFRKLPLYGVGLGPYKTTGMAIDDLYLLSTSELERKQIEHVINISGEMEKSVGAYEGVSAAKFNSLLALMKTGQADQIGSALAEINQILGVNSFKDKLTGQFKSAYSDKFLTDLAAIRKKLGNPMPVVYPFAGHAQAFAANSANNEVVPEADFSLWSVSKKYFFNKEADLMTYKIFCGGSTSSIDKTSFLGTKIDAMAPQFDPPSLLNKSEALSQYCGSWRKTRELQVFSENLYGQKIGGLSMYDFFVQNFNYNLMGDFTKKENANNFDKWWLENGRKAINDEFKAYDVRFKKLVEMTSEMIFDNKSWYNRLVDKINQSKYLQQSIKANLQFETNFYLQIISRALNKTAVVPLKDKYSYVEKSVQDSKNETFKSINGQATLPEVQKVQDLLNSYYPFIQQDKVNFDQYIAHSKKIDTAINDVLVLAGLKMSSKSNPDLVKQEEELAPLDLSVDGKTPAAITPSSTGSEVSAVTYKDVDVKPNLRQKAIIAAVKGLRAVESEIRRFIRMKISLSQSLELNTKEFMEDWKNTNSTQSQSAPVKASPFGQRQGG